MEAEDVPARARARRGPPARRARGARRRASGVRGAGLLLGAALDDQRAKEVVARGPGARAGGERAPARHHPAGPVAARDATTRSTRRLAILAAAWPRCAPRLERGEGVVTRHFLDVDDLSCDELEDVLATGGLPAAEAPQVLAGPGRRPRVREALGPDPQLDRAGRGRPRRPSRVHPGAEVGIDVRETAEDVARTLACYHAVICARVLDHDDPRAHGGAMDALSPTRAGADGGSRRRCRW